MRTRGAIDAAEVVIVLIDGSEPLTEQDQRVLTMVIETGRALVMAFNKWDLVDDDRRSRPRPRNRPRTRPGPVGAASQHLGEDRSRRAEAGACARDGAGVLGQRISTGRLNTFLKEVVAATPPPVRGGKQPRILFATQATTRPPTFVLFTTGFLEAGYRRFLERRLRETFGFEGSPVRINVRVREKRGARAR